MTQFKDREKAFEQKYEKDKELQFKAQARRNRLLGLWAAEQMGFDAKAAEAYAKEVVASDFEEPGDADVLRKVHADLNGKGITTSETAIRKQMDKLLTVAREQLMNE